MGSCRSNCTLQIKQDSVEVILHQISNQEFQEQAQQSLNNSFQISLTHNLGVKKEQSQKTELLTTIYQRITDELACDINDDNSQNNSNFSQSTENKNQVNNFIVRKNRFIEDREYEVRYIIWKNQIEENNNLLQLSLENISYRSLSLQKYSHQSSKSNQQFSNKQSITQNNLNKSFQSKVKKPKLDSFQKFDELNYNEENKRQFEQQQLTGVQIIRSTIKSEKPPIYRPIQNSQTFVQRNTSNEKSLKISSESKKSGPNSSLNSSTIKEHKALEKIYSELCYTDRKFNQNDSLNSSYIQRKKGILKYKTQRVREILRSSSLKNQKASRSLQKSIYINGRKKQVCFTPETNFQNENKVDKKYIKENHYKKQF